MSDGLPRASDKDNDMVAALWRGGYDVVRQRRSHVYLRHPTRGGLVTVPVHGNEVLDLKVLNCVLT